MDILNLNIDLPKHVCVSKTATQTLVETLITQEYQDIIIVYTGGKTGVYAENIIDLLSAKSESGSHSINRFELNDSSVDEMKRLDQYCSNFTKTPIIIGVGGGSCIDVVKLVAHQRRLTLFIYPTVLSCDCLASPISVLKDDNKKVRLHGSVPNGIFIDISITAKAPKSLILAGVADLMSNASALLDIDYCPEEKKQQGFAILLSQASVNHIVSMSTVAIDRPRFQRTLAQGLILSGLSMNLAGSSITASGSEHLISHAIDYYGFGNCSHGEQVYVGMLVSDLIRIHFNEPSINRRSLCAMKNFGLPEHIDQYGIPPHELVKAIIKAPSLRTSRCSILNKINLMEPENILDIIKTLYVDTPDVKCTTKITC